ncbi:MAG: hypothetical protein J7J32_01355 [Candidatus Atribacteria bacterium]|nr:hypothetical protein [Candidatus Atribacteria bacterium]MCD6350322.1 hypothetical protein [Candidatus Atribacteria bacterium]
MKFFLISIVLVLLQTIVFLFPISVARKCFLFLGELLFLFYRKKLDYARKQWQLVFPDTPSSKIESNLRKVFRHLALSLLEIILIKYKKGEILPSLIEKVSGEEFLQRAFQEKRGTIIIGAHFGNWELLAAWLGHRGYPVEILYKDLTPRRLNNFIRSCRKEYQTGWTNTINAACKALRQGKAVAILVDQKVEGKGINCPFMGITTPSPTLHARLARFFKSPIIPAFIIRKEENLKHEIVFLPPFFAPVSNELSKDIFSVVALSNQIIETFLRKSPTQWLWLHRRWNVK